MSHLLLGLSKPPHAGPGVSHDVVVRSAAETGADFGLSAAVSAAQHGDEDAFRVLYRAVHPGLLRYLWVQVGDAAEDVASEAWLQIARDLRSFRGDAAGFRGWAVTIARHRAVDYARRQHRQPVTGDLPAELAELPSCDDTAGSAIEAMATRDALALIARLPRDQAEAVLLRVVAGLDAKTAGKVLGKRAGAVRTAAYRGLRALAGYVGEPAAPGAAEAAQRTARPARVTPTPAAALKEMR